MQSAKMQEQVSPNGEPRVRSINFTAQEKRVLTNLIAAHPSITNKFCDNGSLSAKHISWSEVYEKFCAAFPVAPLRDIKQLKGCWKRLKMKRRMYPYEPHKWYGADDSNQSDVSFIEGAINTDMLPTLDGEDQTYSEGSLVINDSLNDSGDVDIDTTNMNGGNGHIALVEQLKAEEPLEAGEVRNGLRNMTGSRINGVAATLQNFLAKQSQHQQATANVNPKDQLTSRRKPIAPRRLPIRPASSYLQPPVSSITAPVDINENSCSEDIFLEMAKREHHAKMRILKLKEWKLKNDCMRLNIGLPPEYTAISDDDDTLL